MDGYTGDAIPDINVEQIIKTSKNLVAKTCSKLDLKLLYKHKLNIKTDKCITKTELKFYLKKMEWLTHSD